MPDCSEQQDALLGRATSKSVLVKFAGSPHCPPALGADLILPGAMGFNIGVIDFGKNRQFLKDGASESDLVAERTMPYFSVHDHT